MEKQQLIVSNGGGGMMMKLPIGFRFRPTDEELLVHYLKRMTLSLPLPAPVIPVFNVFLSDPWALPGDLKEKRYFFCKGKCGKITPACSGYWKLIGKDRRKGKEIVASAMNQVVGTRKSLAFYHGKHPHGSRTSWVMHEYHLFDSTSTQNPVGHIEDWVVCLVFQRKRQPRNHGVFLTSTNCKKDFKLTVDAPSYIDFKMEDNSDLGPPQPYSPRPSDLTDDLDLN
ncbi:hypothetical protein Ancab_003355 [Ancistrocladus abbreviatus]